VITTSAPGSVMITGEHAVLHGASALVGAVGERVTVTLTPRSGRRVVIRSALGTRETDLDSPDASPPFRFIGGALEMLGPRCPSGFDLDIAADMPPDVGLGSSAAVTVATLAGLHAWCSGSGDMELAPEELHRQALAIVRSVQGAASGADVAASIWGGVLCYGPSCAVRGRYTVFPPVALVYAGYKTPTAEVIRQVESRRTLAPDGFRGLYTRMGGCTGEAAAAFAEADWPRLAEALRQGQSLMVELGVCDDALADILRRLRGLSGVDAAKISGSGLGDCVLVLGHLSAAEIIPYRRIPIQFSPQGVSSSSVTR